MKEVNMIFWGILSVYLNEREIIDFKIFAEILGNFCLESDITSAKEFHNLIFNDKDFYCSKEELKAPTTELLYDERINLEDSFVKDESVVEAERESQEKVAEELSRRYYYSKIGYDCPYSILEVTELIVNKYSLLGQMNLKQIINLTHELLSDTYGPEHVKIRDKYCKQFLNFVEEYFDYSKKDAYDITLLHSLFILVFNGTTREKVRSLFLIFETDESGVLDVECLTQYLENMFDFMLREMDVRNEGHSEYMSKKAIELIEDKEDGISFERLVDFYEKIKV